MKFFKKTFFVIFSFSVLLFLILNVFSIQQNSMEQFIINPLNVIVASDSSLLNTNSISNYKKDVTNFYSEGINYPNDISFNTNNKIICVVGGNYLLQVLSNPDQVTKLFNRSVNLFYCKTTQDLINMIKIPSGWVNDNLILYCNDGSVINSQISNFDFLTSKLSTYKSCILKNLDKSNTIIYGLDTGNLKFDSNSNLFFNDETKQGSIIHSNFEYKSKSGEIYIFNDTTDKKNYYFTYDNLTKFYTLSDNILNSNLININTIFTTNIGISRIALHRSFSQVRQIYGYESAVSNQDIINLEELNVIIPVYKIKYGNSLSLTNEACANYLQKYGSKSSGLLGINDAILCKGSGLDKEILINSKAIDGINYGVSKVDSFNLFKNIILGLN